MSLAYADTPSPDADALRPALAAAAQAAAAFTARATEAVRARVGRDGRIDRTLLDREQHVVHGLAWYATYAELFRQVEAWAGRLAAENRFGEVEQVLAGLLAAEYAAQLMGGIPMNGSETIRPADFGLPGAALGEFYAGAWADALAPYGAQAAKTRAAELAAEAQAGGGGRATVEATGLDADMEMIRDQFRAFSDERVAPFAHGWHLRDELIPLELVEELGALGVFGLTVEEQYGGSGMGKTAMCVVSEELSRGYIGVGSLGTRSEIAAELIATGGTEAQKREWLPKIASGEVLPTAVFTEPDTGSDLGALRTRAERDGDAGDWIVTGNKTWITHAARADMMTMLVRTVPGTDDHRGLSMLLAPKPRGTDEADFPVEGMTGGEIAVLGYRGMKEYELGFDGFRVPAAALLGEREGQGFRQLMATFESARIQTAARAVGVAQAALESGLAYAAQRRQFGRPLLDFPRVHNKLALAAAEIAGVRQLTYFAAARKDAGERCDLEAGLAKLLAARVAWTAADGALQVHGGNGFALEYPISRILCDARILNIFEGAGEIQAQVIARRLLEE